MSIDVAIPIFDEFTALDAVGPYEVLSRLPGATVTFVAIEPGPKRTENGMLALIADRALVDLPHPTWSSFPAASAPGRCSARSGSSPGCARPTTHSTWTTSVCTGSLLLAAAGILDGLEATTHWLAMDELAEQGVTPVSRRIVEQGKVLTAAGVSAGIDMALLLASRIAGEELARAIQLGIEYDPDPPFPGGSLETSPPEIVELVRRHVELA